MKKIMFNDKYGLTQAVLDGRKTMTRRVVHFKEPIPKKRFNTGYDTKTHQLLVCNDVFIAARSQYAVGEIVAISQSYESMATGGYLGRMLDGPLFMKKEYVGAGYKNKMFVKAEHMPHHIEITGIRVEHLQDISDEDCLKEGVLASDKYAMPYGIQTPKGVFFYYSTPREAFAALIDKVSGRGTWKSNPLVWVYEFELVD